MEKASGIVLPHGRSHFWDEKLARFLAFCCVLLLAGVSAPAQDIVTAQDYFGKVSTKFGAIKDYSCDFVYTREETVSSGKLYYKTPNLLRLNYSTPAGQVVLMDGEKLQVFIPALSLILEQTFAKKSAAQLEAMAGGRALRMLQDGYDIAYLDSPLPIELDPGSTEKVVKLKLTRRSASEMYREIVLSVSTDFMIRRSEGLLEDRTTAVMDYTVIRMNQNLPASRFREEAWPEANVYSDFLTGDE